MRDLIERYRNLVKTGFDYAEKDKGDAPTSTFEIYIGHFSDIGREIESALSEAEQRVKDARREAVEDVLSALTAHELYQYRPKAFQGFIEYARSTLQSEER